MNGTQNQSELFTGQESIPEGTVVINHRCQIRSQGGLSVVVIEGLPVSHYRIEDRMAEAYTMINLVEQGWAKQNQVSQAFSCTTRTIRRLLGRFECGGLAALGRQGGYPKGRPRADKARLRRIEALKSEGLSNREIGRRIGVDEKAIRKALRRLGWKHADRQLLLRMGEVGADPNLSGSTSSFPGSQAEADPEAADSNLSADSRCTEDPLPFSVDINPQDRRFDRLLAYLGYIEDAVPLFGPGQEVPHAGVLLAIPAIVQSGVIDCARNIYGSIGPAFYGLRTTMVTLLLMALLRIKRPENLKEHSPASLGRVLGLDRAPEVKTLRRKLTRLASFNKAVEFGRALARKRVDQVGGALGFLYVDGHVRVYHGQHTLPKAYVTKKRLALPATTDYWVNDSQGDPLLVITAEANEGLVKMLPDLLTQVRSFIGQRSTTVVFDRGGWSPKLFEFLVQEEKFHVLTYRKGRTKKLQRRSFSLHEEVIEGQRVSYLLNDRQVKFLKGRLKLRQVTRLCDDGHQTSIITSRQDLTAAEVAYRMFDRWRQENFFKYLCTEYALDALVDYDVEPADPDRMVPNPRRAEVAAKLGKLRAELVALEVRYGIEALTNLEELRKTMRGFKIAHASISKEIIRLAQRHADLEKKRSKMPSHVPVKDVVGKEVVKLSCERKHLTNVMKMVAYQVESDLVQKIAPHYSRVEDEGRTLVQTALAAAGDIKIEDRELRVHITPLSSPHLTKAVASLCTELNKTNTIFPGTNLRLRYSIKDPP